MSTEERNTHFASFAKNLWDEIEDEIIVTDDSMARRYHPLAPAVSREIELLIARRAYDLLKHVVENTKSGTLETAHFYFDDSVSDIPDMRQWPEQSE